MRPEEIRVPELSIIDDGFAYQVAGGELWAAYLGPRSEIAPAVAWSKPQLVDFSTLVEPSFDRLCLVRFCLDAMADRVAAPVL
jgi:hypothetical protein